MAQVSQRGGEKEQIDNDKYESDSDPSIRDVFDPGQGC